MVEQTLTLSLLEQLIKQGRLDFGYIEMVQQLPVGKKKSWPSNASIEGKSLQLDTPVESVAQAFHKLDHNVAVVMTVPSRDDTFQ